MPTIVDIYLRQGEAAPMDIRLCDPTMPCPISVAGWLPCYPDIAIVGPRSLLAILSPFLFDQPLLGGGGGGVLPRRMLLGVGI